jgi:hypothetical protein
MGKNACMSPDDPKPDVLSSLPRTRPQRRSAKRDAVRTGAKKDTPARAGVPPAGDAATKRAAAKPASRPAAARPRAKAPEHLPPAGFAPPRDPEERPAPSGVELVGTAIQAAGELAQIGLAVGGQALRSALARLGRS